MKIFVSADLEKVPPFVLLILQFNIYMKSKSWIALLEGFNQSIGACDLGQLFLLRESGTMVEQDPKIYLVLQISHTMITMICSDKVIRCVCFQNLNDYTNVLLLLPEIRFDFPTHQWQSNLLQIFRPHSKANKAIRDIWRCNTAMAAVNGMDRMGYQTILNHLKPFEQPARKIQVTNLDIVDKLGMGDICQPAGLNILLSKWKWR